MRDELLRTLNEFHTIAQYHQPYTEKEINRIYWLGVIKTLKLLKEEMYLYPMGGVCKKALTEADIDAMIRFMEAKKDEVVGQ